MNIIGVSAFYHDSAAALCVNGEIIAAAQEERFTRKKHDAAFPSNAIQYCLKESGLTLSEVDAIVFYDKPLLKFERLLETYYAFSPKGLKSFMTSMPIWLKEKLFLKREIRSELKQIGKVDWKKTKLLFPEHHLSHAASAFYPSGFESAAILTIDGVGEWATASICHGKGKDITVLKELHFPHSLGLLYSAFTYFLGFKVNSGEYKLMGLAPYGNPESEQTKKFVELIKSKLVEIKTDGSIWLNQKFFNYATGLKMTNNSRMASIFGIKKREPETEFNQEHCNLAMAIQQVTEEIVLKMSQEAQRLTGEKNLCLAGGVALNCVANGHLERANIFEKIFIQPAAGDAGGAIGGALAASHISFGEERKAQTEFESTEGSYLGPAPAENEIEVLKSQFGASYESYPDSELNAKLASLLSNGNIVGRMSGRMEFGPRALGNRSILADPRNEEMQLKLNLKIKYRESFRPFAPAVLAKDVSEYFDTDRPSPYMLLVHDVAKSHMKELPDNYAELGMKEKLYVKRSSLPSITHVNGSARIQTVHKETNAAFHDLLSEFKRQTGIAVLINTSFNVRGEPIVCTPEDAYRCFMRTEMDVLVINNSIFMKPDQPVWPEKDEWKTEFVLD
ncbi:MAG: carbamoyltransferase [Bacteroidia bacterium]|jgi:carbamoyltransferase